MPLIPDSSSISNTYRFTNYHDFSDDVIGALKLQLQSVHGIDKDVRLSNRLHISKRRLRGFVRGKVGPKDGDDWIGGNYMIPFSLE